MWWLCTPRSCKNPASEPRDSVWRFNFEIFWERKERYKGLRDWCMCSFHGKGNPRRSSQPGDNQCRTTSTQWLHLIQYRVVPASKCCMGEQRRKSTRLLFVGQGIGDAPQKKSAQCLSFHTRPLVPQAADSASSPTLLQLSKPIHPVTSQPPIVELNEPYHTRQV